MKIFGFAIHLSNLPFYCFPIQMHMVQADNFYAAHDRHESVRDVCFGRRQHPTVRHGLPEQRKELCRNLCLCLPLLVVGMLVDGYDCFAGVSSLVSPLSIIS